MILTLVAAITICLASLLIGKISIFFIGLMFLCLGHFLIGILSDKSNKKIYNKIFNISFIVYALYALMCRMYMLLNEYDYLLVTDTITAYIPYTEEFMQMNSFSEMWDAIYGPEALFKYTHVGIITLYFTGIAKLVEFFDHEWYYNFQLSIIFLSSFVPVFVYKLLKRFEISNAYQLAFIYAFLSVFLYYSTLILRDAPLALIYCIVFSYVFDFRNKYKSLIVLALCATATFLLRPQMGIFLITFFFIPIFKKNKNIVINSLYLLVFVLVANYIANYFNFYEVYEETMEAGESRLQELAGDSTLNSLNALPFGISHLAKLIFVQLSPIPCWSFMEFGDSSNAAYNIMGFSRAIAVFYNYVVLVFVVYAVFKYKTIKYNKQILLAFFLVIIFLILQSDTTEQRRIMSCYPILLLVSALCYEAIGKNMRTRLFRISIILFVFMQFLGITKFL